MILVKTQQTRGLDRCPEKLETLFIEKLKNIEEIANRRKNQQEAAQPNKVRPDIQQRMRDMAKKLAFDVEEVVEQQIDSGFKEKFNFKTFVKQNKISKPVAKHLKEEINLMAEEIRLAKKGNPDLKEAYSHLNGIIKNRLIKFYDNLIEECDNIQTVKKESSKPVKLNWYRRNKNKKKKKK